MKKLLIPFLFGAVALTSCKKEEKQIQEPMTDPPVENSSEVTTTNTAEDVKVPSFKYAEAEQFSKEYVAFLSSYKVAVVNKDTKTLKELGPKLNEYQKRGIELAKRVPQEEAVAFQDFLNKIEQEIN